jgi:hypothetical protein
VHPWNPGYFLGCKVNARARPVKGRAYIAGNGLYIFTVAGDSKIDFNPDTGNVDVMTHVAFNPICTGEYFFSSSTDYANSCSWREANKENKEKEKTKNTAEEQLEQMEPAHAEQIELLRKKYDQWGSAQFNGFDIHSFLHYDRLRDSKDVDEWTVATWFGRLFKNYNDSSGCKAEAKEFCNNMKKKKMTFEEAIAQHLESESFASRVREQSVKVKPLLDEIINSGVIVSFSGTYASGFRPKEMEGVANAFLSLY